MKMLEGMQEYVNSCSSFQYRVPYVDLMLIEMSMLSMTTGSCCDLAAV